jgi:hypothetical protein
MYPFTDSQSGFWPCLRVKGLVCFVDRTIRSSWQINVGLGLLLWPRANGEEPCGQGAGQGAVGCANCGTFWHLEGIGMKY